MSICVWRKLGRRLESLSRVRRRLWPDLRCALSRGVAVPTLNIRSRRRDPGGTTRRPTLSSLLTMLALLFGFLAFLLLRPSLLSFALLALVSAIFLEELQGRVILGGVLELLDRPRALVLLLLKSGGDAFDSEIEKERKCLPGDKNPAKPAEISVTVDLMSRSTMANYLRERAASDTCPFPRAQILVADDEQQHDGVDQVCK